MAAHRGLPLLAAAILAGSLGLVIPSEPEGINHPTILPPQTTGMLQVGEELEYHVSYSFFSIGTIRFKVLGKFERAGRTVYRAQTIIDSNPALAWLANVHIRFYGEMDQEVFSHTWRGDDSSKKLVDVRKMNFDYDQHKMFYEVGKQTPDGVYTPVSFDTLKIAARCQDGMSLFFYARNSFRQRMPQNVPTFIDNKEVNTFINFLNERTDMDIDAVDYPVEVNHFDGRADFVGVFGMTGGFEGWFSNDPAGVPIVARMKVILGSIKLELVKWNREGWQPPKFVKK